MTAAAEEFVRPLTFAALTGRKVLTDLFAIEAAIEHISVAQEHDLLAVAPATADLMGRFSHGLANDFLTTLYLAFTGPVVMAPAMNVNMWEHEAMQGNSAKLKSRGVRAQYLLVSDGALRPALDRLERRLGPTNPEVARARNNLAEALRLNGRTEEAALLYESARSALESAFGPMHPDVATVIIFVVALVVLWRTKLPEPLLVGAAAIVGLVASTLR